MCACVHVCMCDVCVCVCDTKPKTCPEVIRAGVDGRVWLGSSIKQENAANLRKEPVKNCITAEILGS